MVASHRYANHCHIPGKYTFQKLYIIPDRKSDPIISHVVRFGRFSAFERFSRVKIAQIFKTPNTQIVMIEARV